MARHTERTEVWYVYLCHYGKFLPMTFTARIKPHSAVWNMWRNSHRISGAIHGVMFSGRNSGSDFFSGILTAEQINALKDHPGVILEVCADAGDEGIRDEVLADELADEPVGEQTESDPASVDQVAASVDELPASPPSSARALPSLDSTLRTPQPVTRRFDKKGRPIS